MKKICIAILTAVLCLSVLPARAAGDPPPGLAGELTIVAKDAVSVTLHAEQTGGTPVTLMLEQYCYQNNIYAGMERVRFTGSTTVTFNIGPRTYHGQLLTPTDCKAEIWYYYSSSRGMYLAGVTTLP
jgi:hypothetical protein